MKICKGPECGRPSTAKGLCSTHYLMKRRTGELKPIRRQVNNLDDEELRAIKAAKRTGRPSLVFGKCKLEYCDRDAKVAKSQLCSGHYQQQWDGREFSPLRTVAPVQAHESETRFCNTCLREKNTEEDFYKRSNGGPQPECKFCMGKRARVNRLKQKSRHDEALAVQAAWTAYVRVLNTDWTLGSK